MTDRGFRDDQERTVLVERVIRAEAKANRLHHIVLEMIEQAGEERWVAAYIEALHARIAAGDQNIARLAASRQRDAA